MKKFVAVFLLIMLVISSFLLLAACSGGVESETDWNDGEEYYDDKIQRNSYCA